MLKINSWPNYLSVACKWKPNSKLNLIQIAKSKPIQPRNSNLNHIQTPNLKMKRKKPKTITLPVTGIRRPVSLCLTDSIWVYDVPAERPKIRLKKENKY